MHASTTRASASPASVARRPLPILLKASLACHVGAAAAGVAAPALWPWALGSVALNHAVISATGLWPRSTWLGPNLRRLPAAAAARREIALTIDDGPNPALTPAVLDLLDAHAATATFFCIARAAEQHPALCREIVRRGHSVQNHSLDHAHTFSLLGPRGYAREIARAQDVLSQITGQVPRFFRAPAGLRNLFLAPVLDRHGLQLVSWTRRGFDTVRRDPEVVLRGLTRELAAGDIVLLHDTNAARTASGVPVILEVLPALLRRFAHDGLRAVTLTEAISQAVDGRALA
jgi:peptidoglycan/xylan/chitin deacetylase (PgdA/CDA1 family)